MLPFMSLFGFLLSLCFIQSHPVSLAFACQEYTDDCHIPNASTDVHCELQTSIQSPQHLYLDVQWLLCLKHNFLSYPFPPPTFTRIVPYFNYLPHPSFQLLRLRTLESFSCSSFSHTSCPISANSVKYTQNQQILATFFCHYHSPCHH